LNLQLIFSTKLINIYAKNNCFKLRVNGLDLGLIVLNLGASFFPKVLAHL